MNKIKMKLRGTLAYILSRRMLKYSLILILLVLPVGTVLTNKFFNDSNKKEVAKQELSEDKKKDAATGTIKTDAVGDTETSLYQLSEGYSDISSSTGSGESSNSSSNNSFNSNSSTTVNKDKSSLLGIDIEILEGHEFNPKKDLQLKATDKDGSNISDNIIIEKNTVNTTKPGNYGVRASVRLSDGQKREKEFDVSVKETRLDVALESFRPVKEMAKKGEKIVFDLDLNVSKNHVTPTLAMINGEEYTLYKGEERILDKLASKKRYKVIINASDIAGVQQFNLEHVKMSNGSWISLGENIANVEVLKEVASVKNFTYEEQSLYKRVKANFNLEDIDNTASKLKLEFYKDNELVKTQMLDKKSEYEVYLPTTSNGKYDFKILADLSLTQGISRYNESKEVIFATSISVSNINQSSLIGKDAEIIQGDKFNPIEDLSLKATDFDGEDITDKIVIEKENIDTKEVGKHTVLAHVVNKRNQKYSKELYVNIKPVAEVIEFNPIKDEFGLDENVSFEIKLKNKRDNAVAEKAIINGKVVNLVYDKFRNSLGNIKTYSANIGTEDSEGNKEYVISKIIMKDGKEFTLNKVSNVDIFSEDTKKDLQSRLRIDRELFDNKESKALTKTTQSRATINGNDSETLNQSVTIKGSVSKKDGSAPDGRLEVELPTAMSFAVDQNGAFTPGSYTITNKSSVGITVSIAKFTETIPRGGINVKPIGDALSNRADVNLALVGDKGYADLGKPIDGRKELLDVNPLGVGTIQLLGQAGNGSDENIDNKGASEDFTLVFQIKKKD